MKRIVLIFVFLVVFSNLVMAHPGRTDKRGCHHDRKHGGRHCHR